MPTPVFSLARLLCAMIPALTIAAGSGALHAQPAYPVPTGVYCSCGPTLASGPGSVDPVIASKPFVKGILVRVGWNLVEPSGGAYNWAPLDTQLARARLYGKKVALSVVNGPSAPAWLYAAGVQHAIIGAPHNDTIPYPWDSTYLARWTGLIARLGERYGRDTTITIVHMTNASANGFEFFLNPSGIFNWTTAGYTDAKIIDSWRRVVDAFGAAFPDHYLDNDFHPIFLTANSSNAPGDSVYVYAARTLGPRYGAFASWWSQKNASVYTAQYEDLLASARSSFATVQFAYNGTRDSAAFGAGGMPGALQRAIDDGICYWEIWNQDILNPAFESLLSSASCSPSSGLRTPGEPTEQPSIVCNPGASELIVRAATPADAPLELCLADVSGRTLLCRVLAESGGEHRVDVSAMNAGVYVARLALNGRTLVSRRVVLFGRL